MRLNILGKNTIIYSVGTIGLRLSAFLLIPIYTRTLSIEEYGLLVTLLITIQILISLMGLGNRRSFIRFAKEYERMGCLGQLLGSSLIINLIGGLVVSLLSFFLLKPVFQIILHVEKIRYYILLICGVAIFQSLFLNIVNYYRANNDGLKFMLSNLLASFVLILTTILFINLFEVKIFGILVAQIFTYGFLGMFLLIIIIPKTGLGISFNSVYQLLVFGLPLIFSMTADLALDTSAIYFLGFFTNLKTVAIYSLAYKFAQIGGMVLILPFQLAFEPFVFANINRREINIIISRLLTYLCFTYSLVAFGIIFFSRELLKIIAPPEYFSAYLLIFFLLPGIGFKGIHYIGQALLHIRKKTYITGSIAVLFTLFGLIFNFLMIKKFGVVGAIVNLNLILIGSALTIISLGLKNFPIPIEKKRLFMIGLVYLFLNMLVYFLNQSPSYIYYTVIPIFIIILLRWLFYIDFFGKDEKTVIFKIFQKIFSLASI